MLVMAGISLAAAISWRIPRDAVHVVHARNIGAGPRKCPPRAGGAAGRCRLPRSCWLLIDGEGELLDGLLAEVVGQPHGEGVGPGRGGRPGEFIIGVTRVGERLQAQARRELS